MAAGKLDTWGGAIGFADSAIGLIGDLVDTLFPKPPPESMNNFRVHVGIVDSDDKLNGLAGKKSLSGNAPALAAWDAGGGFLGQITHGLPGSESIADPGFRDYQIEGRGGADYLSVVQNGNDGICIHLITAQSANAGLTFVWTGDIGKACGAPWYPQSNVISQGQGRYAPACVWIDGNGDSGHNWKGFNMHLGSFPAVPSSSNNDDGRSKVVDAWKANKDLMCKSEPRFSMYEDIKIGNQIRTYLKDPTTEADPASEAYADKVLNPNNWYWGEKPTTGQLPLMPNGKTPRIACFEDDCHPEGPSFDKNLAEQQPTRRSLRSRNKRRKQADHNDNFTAAIKKRQEVHADRLVISEMQGHSAIEVCNSQSSLGPDFVSLTEMMFCDMSEKTVWPICTDSLTSYCFDMDTQTVKGSMISLTTTNQLLYTNGTDFTELTTHLAIPDKLYTSVSRWEALI